jgi:hypothetical protein
VDLIVDGMSLGRVGLALAVLVATSGCTLIDALGPEPYRGVGAAYEDYLAGDAEEIVVEIDHAPGARWDASTPAEENFVDQVERITAKEVTVRYSEEIEARGSDYSYALSELEALHEEHRDRESGNGTEVIHALFVDGEFEGSVAGLAFAERAFAIFKGQIEEGTCANDEPVCNARCPEGDPTCTRWTKPTVREWKVTRSVAIHEAGHLFGLVASPLPMVQPHEMAEDPRPETQTYENASHSSNESSVMFWKVENPQQADDLVDGGEVPWRFGELDVRDARALQDGSTET